MMIKFCCEYCKQPIGYVVSDVALPLVSSQFKSIMPDNGVPDPFHKDAEWLYWKCPYCGLRPFIDDKHVSVLREDGSIERVEVEEQAANVEVYRCSCGKEYKHQSSLARHKRECDGGNS